MKNRSLLALVLAAVFCIAAPATTEAQSFCVPPSTPPKPPPPEETPNQCEAENKDCKDCFQSPCHIGYGIYVNDFSDLTVRTASFSLQVNRRYVSSRVVDGPMGIGWTTSLTPRIYYAAYLFTAPSTYAYEARVMLPDGVVYKYTSSTGGNFTPPGGRTDKLVRNADGSWDMTLQDTTVVVHFDSNGLAQTVTDEFGSQLGYVYDAQGRLQKIEDRAGSGRYLDVVWGSDGRVSSVTARATSSPSSPTKTVQYTFNPDGTLHTVTDPANRVSTHAYTPGRFAPLLYTIHDHWNRLVTRLTFDSSERLTGYTDGDPAWGGEQFTYAYYPAQGLTMKTSGTGTMPFYYTTYGFLTNQPYMRDAGTGRLLHTTYNGYTHQYLYDADGRVTVEGIYSGVYSVWMKYAYDPSFPNMIASVEPYKDHILTQRQNEWRAWYYTYYPPADPAHGRLKQIEVLRKDLVTKDIVSRYGYDNKGRITSSEDVGVAVPTTYGYNAQGDLITETDSGTVTYGYDALGRQTSVTDKMGATTSWTLDALDRIMTITFPAPAAGSPVFQGSFSYDHFDAVKNLVFTHKTDVNGFVSKEGFDALGHEVENLDPLGNLTKYTYTNNLLTKITDANGNETSYTYTGDRRRWKTTFPDGTTETLSYTNGGQIASKIDRAGLTFYYTYDAHDRLIQTSWRNGQRIIENSYLGREMVDAVRYYNGTAWDTTTYTYDQQYRVLTETQNNRGKLTYAYFAANPSPRVAQMKVESVAPLPGPVVTTDYQYDTMGRVKQMYWSASGVTYTLNYNLNGAYTTITDTLGHSREHLYDNQGRLTYLANKRNGSNLASFTYAYDYNWATGTNTMLGQRTSVNVTANSQLNQRTGQTKFYYDARYQLTKSEHAAGTTTWTYDAIGNRLTEDSNVYSYYQNALAKNTQRMRTINGSSTVMTYDSYGNLKTWSSEYIWDDLGRLMKRQNGSNAIGFWYEYDAQGRRATREYVAEKYAIIHHGLHAVSERRVSSLYNRTDSSEYLFGPGVDETIAMKTQDGAFFSLVDGLGSVIGRDSSDYELTGGTSYSAFGRPTHQWPDYFAFTGREVVDNNYYYYRARVYDPKVGRFLSEDPEGYNVDTNFYRYAYNRPTSLTDPLGRAPAGPGPGPGTGGGGGGGGGSLCCKEKQKYVNLAKSQVCKNSQGGPCGQVLKKYGLDKCFAKKCKEPTKVICIPKEGSCGGCGGPCNSIGDYKNYIFLQPDAGSGLCGPLTNTWAHEMAHMCGIGPDVYNEENAKKAYDVGATCGGV